MTVFTILLGGDLVVTDRLYQQILGSRFIAADGGIAHARVLGVMPELWLGDFDSSTPEMFEEFKHVERQQFPVAKAATDGELAVEEAIKRGATSIILCGAFGGARTDHGLLHMTFAVALAKTGMPVFLTSGNEEGWPLLKGDWDFNFPQGTLISIIGFSDFDGLSLKGSEWELDNAHVPFGSSLTLSNRIRGSFKIGFDAGYGILLASPYSIE